MDLFSALSAAAFRKIAVAAPGRIRFELLIPMSDILYRGPDIWLATPTAVHRFKGLNNLWKSLASLHPFRQKISCPAGLSSEGFSTLLAAGCDRSPENLLSVIWYRPGSIGDQAATPTVLRFDAGPFWRVSPKRVVFEFETLSRALMDVPRW